MATEQLERTVKPTPPAGRWDRLAAWSLLAALVVVLGAAVVLGERRVEVAELREAIAAGDVTEVRLSENGGDGIGYWTVVIRWTEHGLDHMTTVVQASSPGQARQVQRPADVVVVGDVADALATDGREVTVVGSTPGLSGGGYATLLGFTAPGWVGAVMLVVWCATLLLVGSIESWRATRWGWAWLILLTPIGMPLFLLFGGLTGLLRPRPGFYRLTGGWAFVLGTIVGSALR